MLGGLIGRMRGAGRGALPPPRPDRLTYAVGDVHGRSDLLLALLDRIAADAARAGGPARLVLLGDYVDRGPDARGVLDILAPLAGEAAFETVFLMGNHERMLLDFLDDPAIGRIWLRAGGAETLASYAIAAEEGAAGEPETLAALSAALEGALGPHRAFLEGLAPSHLGGTLLCTHAGADPDRAPEAQDEAALLWGRSEFRRRARRDGLWTLHGHFVVPEPEVVPGRIAIDTGAWFTDRLTAARIGTDGAISFLST